MSHNTGFQSIARAFVQGKAKRLKNDETDGTQLRYHGNVIAVRNPDGSIRATLAGWNTVSTRARFNKLSDVLDSSIRVFTRKWEAHLWNWRTREELGEIGSRDWFTLTGA